MRSVIGAAPRLQHELRAGTGRPCRRRGRPGRAPGAGRRARRPRRSRPRRAWRAIPMRRAIQREARGSEPGAHPSPPRRRVVRPQRAPEREPHPGSRRDPRRRRPPGIRLAAPPAAPARRRRGRGSETGWLRRTGSVTTPSTPFPPPPAKASRGPAAAPHPVPAEPCPAWSGRTARARPGDAEGLDLDAQAVVLGRELPVLLLQLAQRVPRGDHARARPDVEDAERRDGERDAAARPSRGSERARARGGGAGAASPELLHRAELRAAGAGVRRHLGVRGRDRLLRDRRERRASRRRRRPGSRAGRCRPA